MSKDCWNAEAARNLYNLEHWSGGFFDIDAAGEVRMHRPDWPEHPGVSLFALARRLRAEHVGPPVLVRFQDILGARVQRLRDAFDHAAGETGYTGGYTSIYPIKVNQQRSVVERILAEPGTRVGLEAGSKSELIAVLALAPAGSVIVCNGYKDREYMRLALIGQRLGHRVYVVIEKPSELDEMHRQSRAMGIDPLFGLRVRLASVGKGKWQNTGGDKAKFGLSAAEVLQLLARLRELGWLERLQLLHFHMGSQIANIADIQAGMGEAARYFTTLIDAGVPLAVVDVGGGLGIDYEGARSRSDCSMNYSLEEYALNILRPLAWICRERNRPMPEIFTESGRAMTAHHAVLITNVIDIEPAPGATPPSHSVQSGESREEPEVLQAMSRLLNTPGRPASEIYHDAVYGLRESQALFTRGILDLTERARAEDVYFRICRELLQRADHDLPAEIHSELVERLADKVFCNFSVFQSIPDAWAIDQIFPILPLHRLDERPERRAVLQDLTCDSDGHIDRYVCDRGITSTLPLHGWQPGQDYFLGIFLVGAYQEILGDLHNLFGDTDSINVELMPDGGYRLLEPERGDTIDELLRYVHFEPDVLRRKFREKIYSAGLHGQEAGSLLGELEHGLTGYTYLED